MLNIEGHVHIGYTFELLSLYEGSEGLSYAGNKPLEGFLGKFRINQKVYKSRWPQEEIREKSRDENYFFCQEVFVHCQIDLSHYCFFRRY